MRINKYLSTAVLAGFLFSGAYAQDDLIKKVNANQSQQEAIGYRFTEVINLSYTPVENQGSSGTCWSYSTNSFLESEMIKAGRKPVHLSKIFTARQSYLEKAENYLRMDGHLRYGDGGQAHDVINMYAKYGTLPEEAYTGLIDGATRNNFKPMQSAIKAMLKQWLSEGPPENWKAQINDTLDAYLGAVPESFSYEGKTYTPESFAKEYVGLDPNQYIEIMSQQNTPYWEQGLLMIPDNWIFSDAYYNVPMEAFTQIIDHALEQGYTVGWDTDVSEPYFSWLNGIALVPENAVSLDKSSLTKAQINGWFQNEPIQEMDITPEIRQQGYNDKTTTDDHLMHIVGLAKDQNGKEFYIVKNSWGTNNLYEGFLYVSKAYVQYKTLALMVNTAAVPKDIARKMGI